MHRTAYCSRFFHQKPHQFHNFTESKSTSDSDIKPRCVPISIWYISTCIFHLQNSLHLNSPDFDTIKMFTIYQSCFYFLLFILIYMHNLNILHKGPHSPYFDIIPWLACIYQIIFKYQPHGARNHADGQTRHLLLKTNLLVVTAF